MNRKEYAKRLMSVLGLSQSSLAKSLCVNQPYLSMLLDLEGFIKKNEEIVNMLEEDVSNTYGDDILSKIREELKDA